MLFLVLFCLWVCIGAGALFWIASKAGVSRTHAAAFALSVAVAFLIGNWLHFGQRSEGTAVVAGQAAPAAALPQDLFKSAYGGLQFPPQLAAGTAAQGSVVVENRSSIIWPAQTDPPLLLGFHWIDASGKVIAEGRGGSVKTPLSPGARRRFPFVATAPGLPGRYTLKVDMLYETVRWFESPQNPAITQIVTVV